MIDYFHEFLLFYFYIFWMNICGCQNKIHTRHRKNMSGCFYGEKLFQQVFFFKKKKNIFICRTDGLCCMWLFCTYTQCWLRWWICVMYNSNLLIFSLMCENTFIWWHYFKSFWNECAVDVRCAMYKLIDTFFVEKQMWGFLFYKKKKNVVLISMLIFKFRWKSWKYYCIIVILYV